MVLPDQNQLRELDKQTIKVQDITSLDLMERASLKWLDAFLNDCRLLHHLGKKTDEQSIFIFCGPGNNGGDGLVIARHLYRQGFAPLVFVLNTNGKFSDDHLANRKRLEKEGCSIRIIGSKEDFPSMEGSSLIIDALFGYGLNGELNDLPASLVDHLNDSGMPIFSVDVPSGLTMEGGTENKNRSVIRAFRTYTFHSPKLSFFFPENAKYTGAWKVLDIGLDTSSIEAGKQPVFLIHEDLLRRILRKRDRFSHKGDFGHALLLAGSKGKVGAALLSAEAALRSGCGLLTVSVPSCGETALHTALPEAMLNVDENNEFITALPHLDAYASVGIGPGLGREKQTGNVVKLLLQQCKVPLVMDADALNMLSENKTWLAFLPAGTILTPHPGEFDRLFGKHSSGYDRFQTAREMAVKYNVFIVLKGAFTCIAHPDGSTWFNTTGNPGMAKGGSGDVLTGMLIGLTARGYSPFHACILGVWLHGTAGDIAVEEKGIESVLAGDLTSKIAVAFGLINA